MPAAPAFTLGGYAGQPGEIEGAGFGVRLGARLIDIVVHIFVNLLVGMALGFIVGVYAGMTHRPFAELWAPAARTGAIGFLSGIVGALAYHAFSEGLGGSTVGKRALSLKVVREDGSPCGLTAALIRSAAYLLDALFFGLIGYFAMQKSRQQQRYGDQWAHTVVCKLDQAPGAPLNLALGVFVGVVADAVIVAAPIVINILIGS
jgi:uncharacterized RDD family membrane protein YckC